MRVFPSPPSTNFRQMVAEDENTLNILRSSGFSGVREKVSHPKTRERV